MKPYETVLLPVKVTQGQWNRHRSMSTYDFLLVSGPISYRFGDKKRY